MIPMPMNSDGPFQKKQEYALPRLVLLLTAMALLPACTGILSPRESSIAIHSGTEGILAQFVSGAPPVRMLEDADAPVIIQLENQGAFSVQNLFYTITGDTGFVTITDPDGTMTIEGRSKTNPIPGKSYIETKMRAGVLDPQRQIHDAHVTASMCYTYETHAALNVCIDTDPLTVVQRRKTCTASLVSGGGGQGGPVAVTQIEPSMVPEGDSVIPSFIIHVTNAGRGLVVDPKKVSLACQPFGQGKDLFDTVEITARLTDTPLVCERTLKLTDGKAEVECISSEPFPRALGSYLAPLSVNLKYGYTQSITVPVKIERQR